MGINDRMRDARKQASEATLRARRAAAGQPHGPGWLGATLLAGAAAIGGAIAAFLTDPQRGRARRAQLLDQSAAVARRAARHGERAVRLAGARAAGAMAAVQHSTGPGGTGATDDVTLVARAETELFRDPSVPKGQININAERGILVLRGVVPTAEMRERLVREAEAVDGVWSVHDLLKIEGEEEVPAGSAA